MKSTFFSFKFICKSSFLITTVHEMSQMHKRLLEYVTLGCHFEDIVWDWFQAQATPGVSFHSGWVQYLETESVWGYNLPLHLSSFQHPNNFTQGYNN